MSGAACCDGLAGIASMTTRGRHFIVTEEHRLRPRRAGSAVRRATEALLADALSLRMPVPLHFGTIIYANIGAAGRLDTTVIGPAVNLVSRVEAVAKAVDLPVVVSEALARPCGGDLRSVGRRELGGLGGLHELFAPDTPALGPTR
jgi:adenylate cyclase